LDFTGCSNIKYLGRVYNETKVTFSISKIEFYGET